LFFTDSWMSGSSILLIGAHAEPEKWRAGGRFRRAKWSLGGDAGYVPIAVVAK
jgi:hypothetical protein